MAEVEIIRSKTRKQTGPAVQPYTFALEFMRGKNPEVHQFTAYPVLDAGSLNYTLSAAQHAERAIQGMVRTIRKMLADDDGTPKDYQPARYTPPEPDVEPEWHGHLPEGANGNDTRRDLTPDPPDDFDESEDDLLVGPDGEPHDREYISKAMEFESGSSRRRFAYLMDEDEDLTLQADQLETVWKRLVGKAGGRPTRR